MINSISVTSLPCIMFLTLLNSALLSFPIIISTMEVATYLSHFFNAKLKLSLIYLNSDFPNIFI